MQGLGVALDRHGVNHVYHLHQFNGLASSAVLGQLVAVKTIEGGSKALLHALRQLSVLEGTQGSRNLQHVIRPKHDAVIESPGFSMAGKALAQQICSHVRDRPHTIFVPGVDGGTGGKTGIYFVDLFLQFLKRFRGCPIILVGHEVGGQQAGQAVFPAGT